MRHAFWPTGVLLRAWIAALAVALLPAASSISSAQAIELPTIPDPVPVTLNPATTALILSDLMERNCTALPSCVDEMAPTADLLARARESGVLVIYTVAGGLSTSPWMPQIAPLPSEQVFTRPGPGGGNWWGQDAEDALSARGVDTVILVGSQAAGIVLQGAFQSSLLDGYTVVAPVDGMPSPTEFRLLYTEYHVLNMPGGRQNPDNTPLEPGSVTLSRSDLISF